MHLRAARHLLSLVTTLCIAACSTPVAAASPPAFEPAGTSAPPAPSAISRIAASSQPIAPLTAAPPASPAQPPASTAEFHCPQAGLLIRTSTGEQFRFIDANGERCRYVDKNGDTRELYALLVDGFGQAAKTDLDRLWPLRVGNRVEYDIVDTTPVQPTDRFSQRHYHETFEVLRQERIAVPAGSFDAFVLQRQEKEIGRHHDTSVATVTMWYAPQVGSIVKSSVDIANMHADDPFAAAEYANMSYQAAEIVMPDGKILTSQPAAVPGAAPVGTPSRSPASPADRLITLKRLLNEKLITKQEYEELRKAIIDGL